jgi:hypothetical protein
MLSRILSRLAILASIAVLAGVTYYLLDEYRSLRERQRTLREVTAVNVKEGPCAALERLRHLGPVDSELQHTVNGLRSRLVAQVVGDDDLRGRRVLAAADREGLIDLSLCEQIRLSHAVGEVHPVLALLRYTREGGSPCEEEPRLSTVLDGLGSHRPLMLRALLRDIRELSCLSPALSEKIARMAASSLMEQPKLMDDLDVVRIAAYLTEWAPLESAQLACRAEARGERSQISLAIGCTPDARRRILVHYQTKQRLQPSTGAPELPVASDVVLLHESGPFCQVMPAAGGADYTVSCRALRLASDLVLAVRVEALSYGRAEADLVAGLATYVGEGGTMIASAKEPELRSWFAYNREGDLLGGAHRVELSAVAATLGEVVPDEPLRAYCKRTGARYCYDVDWAHVVSRVRGEPVLYLSRPASVFLEPRRLSPDESRARFNEAFGRDPAPGTYWQIFGLAGGGELAVESTHDDVLLRWQTSPDAPWRSQAFGHSEGGAVPPSAQLLAALDVRRDGRPELVLQRVTRKVTAAGAREQSDEIWFLQLPVEADRFSVLNRLTVHEY